METSVSKPSKSIVFTVIGEEEGAQSPELRSVFMVPPGQGTEGYVAIQNTSPSRVRVTITLRDSTGRPFGVERVELSANESQVVELDLGNRGKREQKLSDFGSILLTHDAPVGALVTSGWVENESTGYSNMMTFHDPARHTGTTLLGTQVFLGDNDRFLSGRRKMPVRSQLLVLNSAHIPIHPTADLIFESRGRIEIRPLDAILVT